MKKFNNLFDSIVISVFEIVLIVIALMTFVGINAGYTATNRQISNIVCIIMFGSMILTVFLIIILKCYEYWIVYDNEIQSKKLFKKKIRINKSEIKRIEKKQVPALILGMNQSEAYVIYSDSAKITILINKRNEELLKKHLKKNVLNGFLLTKH